MHLRRKREVHAGRRTTRSRLPLFGGGMVLILGVACLAPLAPTALAPATLSATVAMVGPTPELGGLTRPAAVAPAPVSAAPQIGVPAIAIPPLPVPAAPTPTPATVTSPIPTITPAGQAMLDAIKSDRTSQWVKNHTETPLRSGPSDDSVVFTRLPQWSLLKETESRPDWIAVQYSGDGDTRMPGPGWVRASDVGAVDPPGVWLTTRGSGNVWSAFDQTGTRVAELPSGALMELIGPDFIKGTRVHVRLPGDGRGVAPSEGWVDGDVVARSGAPTYADLPVAYPETLHADVRIKVPYRTQLDGSDFASANCGPTVLGMALESFGVNLPPTQVREQVLDSENFSPTDNDAGSYIWALADVAIEHGLRAVGLYDNVDAKELHRWTTDEVRDSLKRGQPVIVQVVYRGLPGREDSQYYGDHYVIVTGLVGDNFLYNDPIGGRVAREVPGFDRVMTPAQLQRAMRASDTPYANSAFALTRS
jgi:hypothetical protein